MIHYTPICDKTECPVYKFSQRAQRTRAVGQLVLHMGGPGFAYLRSKGTDYKEPLTGNTERPILRLATAVLV